MSEIRSMLADTINKVMKDQCTKELIAKAEKGVFPISLWKTLEELGVMGIGIDEENGGAGGDLGDLMALLKIAGYYAAPIPLAEHILSNWLLSSCGLPIDSEICTLGPVNQANEIHFTEISGGWIVSGKASYVPWGRDAKSITVFGKSDENHLMAAKIQLDLCSINPHENLAGEPRDEVIMNNIHLKKESAAYLEADKLNELYITGLLSRVMLMTGALEKTLDLTVAYSKERTQFGRPISKFQAIQQQLAIIAGEITAAMVIADFVMSNIDDKLNFEEAAMAKIQLGDAAGLVSRIAHQVHAAMGFTDEHPLHLSTRRLWSWRDEFGTESELAKKLGEYILVNCSSNLWEFATHSKSTIRQ
ncbi:acyl-CoA dehydrogenase [Peribacillus saganii]|uniref:Acyl-CoA dehydrogenase n=1 Tax=Peribacillus saganii TaxID=2303992 RepID=A0A372LAL7_9BACI|nr:acyl-CoA dehydrogenase family protein [Peribacillus saganii]RFU62813.1 acyl-CoA dehydrogenase [Peribacillus saganii]